MWLLFRWEPADSHCWAGPLPRGSLRLIGSRLCRRTAKRAGFLQSPQQGGLASVPQRSLSLSRACAGPSGVLPAPSLPHPGPGRAGPVRVSRGRAANKVAPRGSAATAPESALSRRVSECGAARAAGPGLQAPLARGLLSGPRGRPRAEAGRPASPGLRGGRQAEYRPAGVRAGALRGARLGRGRPELAFVAAPPLPPGLGWEASGRPRGGPRPRFRPEERFVRPHPSTVFSPHSR